MLKRVSPYVRTEFRKVNKKEENWHVSMMLECNLLAEHFCLQTPAKAPIDLHTFTE